MPKKRICSEETIQKIRQEWQQGKSYRDLANRFFVHYKTIQNYCRGIKRGKG